MPTDRCCAPWSKRQGRVPEIITGQDRYGWWAIVGSSMFTGYEGYEDMMLDAKRDQATQTVFPCGHVLRQRAVSRASRPPRGGADA